MKANRNIITNQLTELSPVSAWDFLLVDKSSLLIDVRSTMEYLFVGHPEGAIHIPWIDEPDWIVNTKFIETIIHSIKSIKDESLIDIYSHRIILICRSGRRSIESGDFLIQSGFCNVSYVANGFEGELDENLTRGNLGGWRFNKLPWQQC